METASKKTLKKALKVILWVTISGLLLVGGWIVAVYHMMTTPRADFTTESITRDTFTNRCDVSEVPLSATNVFYARSVLSMGFAGAFLYRFDAPTPDCLEFAAQLIEQNKRQTQAGSLEVPTNLVSLTKAPTPIDQVFLKAYGFSKLDWFDVEKIQVGVEGRGPPNGRGLFWIDTERGRFYYYWTD